MTDSLDRREFLLLLASSPALMAAEEPQELVTASTLERLFSNPLRRASPNIYWYWMNANVSPEGITADLESMKANGITAVYLFTIGPKNEATRMQPPAEPLTEHWWDLVKHAVAEADRLEIDLCFNACDGWATAGGPWITPDLSMQNLVWTEHRITGGDHYSGKLQQPRTVLDYYRDIAVLAFPIPATWNQYSVPETPNVTTNLPVSNIESILTSTEDQLTVDTDQPGWIQFEFSRPFTLRSVTITTRQFNMPAQSLEIESSEDGVSFQPVTVLQAPRNGWQTFASPWTHSVPETTARYFRFIYQPRPPQPYAEDTNFIGERKLKLAGIELASVPKINHFEGKSGATWTSGKRTSDRDAPPDTCIPIDAIVDLTAKMSTGGTLDWDAPPGEWLALRVGYTTTGMRCNPAGAGQGLECDKFNPEAARIQFEGWFGEALKRAGPELAKRAVKRFHVDSWECGSQNWSPLFRDEFQKRRGYDLLKYLPAIAGVPVQSADISERFLLDFRRTIAELLVDNFFDPLVKLANGSGCLMSAECTAPTMVGDGMLHYRSVDLPMGEFWLNTVYHDKPNDIRDAVSGAHVYGKRIVQAEAFTEGHIAWNEHPFALKALGDHNFCDGINRFVLHVYAHQAWPDRAPGVTLSTVGTFFSHTQTWWRPARGWFDYLQRCQALLQQGDHVADVCYFTGEDIPSRALLPWRLNPPLPPGYKYDSINRDALLRCTSLENGDILLTGGARYRILVIPEERALTPEVVAKLRELVTAGATIFAYPPRHSPSLANYPHCDEQVRAITRELWADCDGERVKEHRLGGGRVICGRPLADLFSDLNLSPDVLPSAGERIEWTHRQAPEFDLYFVSNQKPVKAAVELSFRMSGRKPELWHPDTGAIEEPSSWRQQDGRTLVELDLHEHDSVFVVFRTHVAKSASGRQTIPQPATLLTVAGPWTLEFPLRHDQPKRVTWSQLASWAEQQDPDIRFFSGTARYSTSFPLKGIRKKRDQRLLLDLGRVANLATVRLNGHAFRPLWKPPFTLDITAVVRPGVNHLEIEVTNTWKNRILGDEILNPPQRSTWLLFETSRPPASSSLDPAGLMGPVEILVAHRYS